MTAAGGEIRLHARVVARRLGAVQAKDTWKQDPEANIWAQKE